MDQLDWEILSLVSITNSATKVAEQLFISQPAVAYRLNKMEEEFQSDLFFRTHKGITLTAAGKVLSSFADPMLDKLKEISISVNLKRTVQDTISIGVPYTLCEFVTNVIKDFNEVYPDLRVHLYTSTSINIVKMFKEGQLSAAFIRGMYGEIENGTTLFEDPMRIISKQPITIERLKNLPFIDFDTTSIQRHWFNLWAANNDIVLKDIFYADKIYACLQMVEAGLGWSAVNSHVLIRGTYNDLHQYIPKSPSGEPLLINSQYLHAPDKASSEVRLFTEFVLDSKRIEKENEAIAQLPLEELL